MVNLPIWIVLFVRYLVLLTVLLIITVVIRNLPLATRSLLQVSYGCLFTGVAIADLYSIFLKKGD